jgi:acyl transferase domain-containing protein
MDRQHRMGLEAVRRVLEVSGVKPSSLRGTQTSSFVGAPGPDYYSLLEMYGHGAAIFALTESPSNFLTGRGTLDELFDLLLHLV